MAAGRPAGKNAGKAKAHKKRKPPVNGCVYTDAMSDAYWQGRQDGKSTATQMTHRAEPKNVRVRALAVTAAGRPDVQELAVSEETAAAAAVFEPPVETELAVPETAETVIAPAEPAENRPEDIAVMNNTEKSPAVVQPEESTYSLKRGEIISGNVRAVTPVYRIEGTPVQNVAVPVQKPHDGQKDAAAVEKVQRWKLASAVHLLERNGYKVIPPASSSEEGESK